MEEPFVYLVLAAMRPVTTPSLVSRTVYIHELLIQVK